MKFAILLLATLAVACPSVAKKTELRVLVPAVSEAWESISLTIAVGIQDGLDDGDLAAEDTFALDATDLRAQVAELDLAIQRRDVDAVAAFDWDSLSIWVERGIQDKLDDGLLVPLTAGSLRERHRQFTNAINELKD